MHEALRKTKREIIITFIVYIYRYVSEAFADLYTTLSWMSPYQPGLLIYHSDCNLPRILLLEFAEKKGQKITVFPISMPDEEIDDLLLNAMSEV